ncbi:MULTISPECIES: GNAT family N-acetyltransferase [Pseudoalteromonas]|uniref:GNAT family N-acetyltransferase n=1 Tax=Pseudoalteromonas obscura TaxID=3048491 RepID=A0ABT7EGG5_9GAMM|nr:MULTISPECIES: GNAT family N-acetyltransferase [Pseudoalteromonas]MBQ4835607.1 GNAT family N-acetyltransferase [Pseudoalteromonas luteoviolacea]MDK2594142.1 GNAT family N-acetyltransferase [Pseudoalteromonas sp. P94(2023)]
MKHVVTLRKLKKTDQIYLVRHLNDAQVIQYLSDRIPQPYTQQDASWWLEVGCEQNAINRAIEVDGQFCGVIGVYLPEGDMLRASAEIGYWVGHEFWGMGIATQAVVMFSTIVFNESDVVELSNPVSAPNKASIRVMEKAGFKLKQVSKKTAKHQQCFFDEHVYSLNRSAFLGTV